MGAKLFRLSAKVLVCDESDRCLLLKRSASCKGNHKKWDLPSGSVRAGEPFDRTLLREVADTTGLTITIEHVLGATEANSLEGKVIHLLLEGRLRAGQVTLGSGYDEYTWVKRRDLPKMELGDDYGISKMTVRLPADAITMKAFKGQGSSKLAPELRETIAQAVHEYYRRVRAKSTSSQDPSIAEWNQLPDYLKESNRQQADHIFDKLHQIGCTVHGVAGRDIIVVAFTKDEVEIMAEMEHARWNVERLLEGWRWGEQRDELKKTSPYLVSWSDLPDEVKEWDRQTVRRIPEFLVKVGLEIRRQSS